MITPAPIIGFPASGFPITSITPLTYRDGITYLEKMELLRRWVQTDLITWMDDTATGLDAAWKLEVITLVDTVNAALAAQAEAVNSDLADQTADNDVKIADLTTFVNDSVAAIINSTIAVTDPVTLAIFNNTGSNTRVAMDAQYGTKRKQDAIALVVPNGATPTQAQDILTAAPSGAVITWEPGSDQLAPAGGFTLTNDGIVIDLRNARIRQAVQSAPAFDLINRNTIIVRGGTIEFTGTPGTVAGNIRGSAAYVSSAAVWGNGDNITVVGNRIINFVCGAFFSSWNGAILNGKYSANNTFKDNEVSGHNFGILYTAQNHLVISGNKFHDDVDGSGGTNPTHSIYGSSTTAKRSNDVQWLNNMTVNHTHGQAYQGKYDDNLVIRNCNGTTISGILNIIDCHDLDIDGMKSVDDIGTTAGSITFQSTDLVSQRPRIKNVDIKYRDSINNRPVLFISQDGKFNNITVTMNPSATWGGATLFEVRGDNNELVNCDGTNNNPAVAVIGVFVNISPTGTNTVVRGGKFKGVSNVVQLTAGCNGARLNLDNTIQTYSGALYSVPNGVDYSTKDVISAAMTTFGDNAALALLAKDSPTHPSANAAVQVKFRPTRDILVTNIYWYSAVQSGNYDLGVFDDVSGVALWEKGAGVAGTPWPAVGLVNEAVTPFILRAGRTYRGTIAADNVIAAYRGIKAGTTGMDRLLGGGTNTTLVGAVFPLPATLVAGASLTDVTPLLTFIGTKP